MTVRLNNFHYFNDYFESWSSRALCIFDIKITGKESTKQNYGWLAVTVSEPWTHFTFQPLCFHFHLCWRKTAKCGVFSIWYFLWQMRYEKYKLTEVISCLIESLKLLMCFMPFSLINTVKLIYYQYANVNIFKENFTNWCQHLWTQYLISVYMCKVLNVYNYFCVCVYNNSYIHNSEVVIESKLYRWLTKQFFFDFT